MTDTASIRNAFQAADQAPIGSNITVQFDSGVYHFDSTLAGGAARPTISGASNLQILGDPNGTTVRFMKFEPHQQAGTLWKAGFQIRDISNSLEIRELDMEVDRPVFTEGALQGINQDAAGNYKLDVLVTDPNLFLDTNNSTNFPLEVEIIFPVHPLGHSRERQVYKPGSMKASTTRPISIDLPTLTASGHQLLKVNLGGKFQAERQELQSYLSSGNLSVVLGHQFDSAVAASGLQLVNCENISVTDCVMRSMQRGIFLQGGSNFTAERVIFEPREPNWLVGCMRGPFGGIYGVRGQHTFRDCHITGAFDDGIDLTGCIWARVHAAPTVTNANISIDLESVRAVTPGTPPTHDSMDYGLEPGTWGASGLTAGSEARFYAPDLSQQRASAPILSVGIPTTFDPSTADGPWNISVAQNPETLSIQAGDAVALMGNVYSGALVSNCSFRGGKGAGVAFSGPNITVEHSTFTNTGHAAIRGHCIFDPFSGTAPGSGLNVTAPPYSNILISSNTITGCAGYNNKHWPYPRGQFWGNSIAAIDIATIYVADTGSGPELKRASADLSSSITVHNNVISDIDRAAISVTSATNVSITHNQMSNVGLRIEYQGGPEYSAVYVEDLTSATIAHNKVVGIRPPTSYVRGARIFDMTRFANQW